MYNPNALDVPDVPASVFLDMMYFQRNLTKRFADNYIYKKDLYECVAEISDSLKLIPPFPICHVMSPLSRYVDVEFRHMKDSRLCGMINKAMSPDKSYILINSNNPTPTQRFSLFHEVIHWFVHPPLKNHYNMPGMNRGVEDYHANEGAAELIIPYADFIPWIANEIGSLDTLSYVKIKQIKKAAAIRYNTSEAIIRFRLESLKYELHQYMYGCDISSLDILSDRQQKTKGITVCSINNIELNAIPKKSSKPYKEAS